MKTGIIGLPQSGKSTLFSAITGQMPDPGMMLHEQTAIIKVPDARLDHLSTIFKPQKTTPATLEVIDFPGLTSSDEHGKQQYKKHLPNIRLCDVLVAIVRDFENASVAPHKDRIDPHKDLEILIEDFILTDLESIATRLERLEKSIHKPTKSQDLDKREHALLLKCREGLENLQPLSDILQSDEERALLRSFAFLTQKPLIVVVNVSEGKLSQPPSISHEHAAVILNISAEAESQISQLDSQEDQRAFLEDLGIEAPLRDRFIQCCFEASGLISFLTVGEDECRAWPIRNGTPAVEAAGKIHTDIARGFIRAETVAYDDFTAHDSDMKNVKAAGRMRLEGKDYIVQDGDIINFRFNI